MKILVLNGSPKGDKSNTLKLTNAFIDGLNEEQTNQVEVIDIKKMDIKHCLGCYVCWTKTPGKCAIKDDMENLISKYIEADLIVWSFPLYYFSMPSKIKAFMDRMLPMNLPFMAKNEKGHGGHPPRHDLSHQRYVLISTCGFFNVEGNYDGLLKQFEIHYGDKLTSILCPEGELIKIHQLQGRITEYLSSVKQAGREYAKDFKISDKTNKSLSELLYPEDAFIQMADASWDINDTIGEKDSSDNSSNFIKQMAAVYNPKKWNGKDVTIEMHFTDINKTYQLNLGKNKCTVNTDNLTEYTTRIETPYDVWRDISNGEIDGSQAMMENKYKVLGDFNTMLNMNEYFGIVDAKITEDKSKSVKKEVNTNMLFLLVPWIALWALLPISVTIGGAIAILISSLIPLISFRFKLTVYDKISIFCVSGLGLLAVLGFQIVALVCSSYIIFGILWLVSSFLKIPLSAFYSSKDYNGDAAFSNPLFIKTNRILSVLWGIMFLAITALAYFLIKGSISQYTGLICSAGSGIMGGFTAWFSKWYPAKIARG